jgi:hypothetical protein
MLARLPEGKTAHQALGALVPNEQWIYSLTEADAGDQYLRVYAPEKDRATVACHRVFGAFRDLGGETYLTAWSIKKTKDA